MAEVASAVVVLDPLEWGALSTSFLDEVHSSLGDFTVWTDPTGQRVTFQRDDGVTFRAEVTTEDLIAAGSCMAAYRAILDRVVCPVCHDSLIEGEKGRCGSCESRMILDLIALKRDLAA